MAFVKKNLIRISAGQSGSNRVGDTADLGSATTHSFTLPGYVSGAVIKKSSVYLVDSQAVAVESWTDDGAGNMTPAGTGGTQAGSSGTIDYNTGVISLTYAGAVDVNEVHCNYQNAGGTDPMNLWMYATNDSWADVITGGYFAEAGSTSGDSSLTDRDVIIVSTNAGDTGGTVPSRGIYLGYVSDAAAGDVSVAAGAASIKAE